MTYVIGIDGGGTKTEVVLADFNGNVVLNKIYGTTNPNAVSKQELIDTFQLLFQELEVKIPGCLEKTISVFAGISGVGSNASRTLLEEIISSYFSTDTKVSVVVDSINALYSGTFGKPGIVQICGTGSITYGINEEQLQDRVGGWGYLLGDEGSGFDVGQKGVTAALHFADGRGEKTILLNKLYEHYQVSHPRELIDNIYHSSSPRMEIASLSKIVFEAYEIGDLVAQKIMQGVTKDVGHSIKTLHTKLFKANEEIDVVLCGGLFSNPHVLPELLKEELRKDSLTLIVPNVPPAVGSVIGAFIEAKQIVTQDVRNKLIEKWK